MSLLLAYLVKKITVLLSFHRDDLHRGGLPIFKDDKIHDKG